MYFNSVFFNSFNSSFTLKEVRIMLKEMEVYQFNNTTFLFTLPILFPSYVFIWFQIVHHYLCPSYAHGILSTTWHSSVKNLTFFKEFVS